MLAERGACVVLCLKKIHLWLTIWTEDTAPFWCPDQSPVWKFAHYDFTRYKEPRSARASDLHCVIGKRHSLSLYQIICHSDCFNYFTLRNDYYLLSRHLAILSTLIILSRSPNQHSTALAVFLRLYRIGFECRVVSNRSARSCIGNNRSKNNQVLDVILRVTNHDNDQNINDSYRWLNFDLSSHVKWVQCTMMKVYKWKTNFIL